MCPTVVASGLFSPQTPPQNPSNSCPSPKMSTTTDSNYCATMTQCIRVRRTCRNLRSDGLWSVCLLRPLRNGTAARPHTDRGQCPIPIISYEVPGITSNQRGEITPTPPRSASAHGGKNGPSRLVHRQSAILTAVRAMSLNAPTTMVLAQRVRALSPKHLLSSVHPCCPKACPVGFRRNTRGSAGWRCR